MSEFKKTEARFSKDRIIAYSVGAAMVTSACSSTVEGIPHPESSWGELEIQESVDALSAPGLSGEKQIRLKVGERVVGVCLAYPSWESATIASGFMKVEHSDKQYYVPTIAGYANNAPQNTFQVPEDVLVESYLRCNDSRRL